MDRRVCLGQIVGAHGVKGLVKVQCFTEEPGDVAAYGALSDEAGKREFRLTVAGPAKAGVLARIEGVADRDAAEALRGVRLYVARDRLPQSSLAEEEFYQADLIGLEVRRADGAILGRVAAIANYGAGDLLEVAREGGQSFFLPFTREMVPVVDLAGGRVIADPPEDWPGEVKGAPRPED